MFIISTFKIIIQSFFHPFLLWKAAEWSRKRTVQLFLFLAFLAGIPFFVQGFLGFSRMSQDIERVTDRLPSFVIQDGKVNLEKPLDKALVVRTDSINLIFDLQGQYDERQEERDLRNTELNLLFKEKSFIMMINDFPVAVSYEKSEGLTDGFFRTFLQRISNNNLLTLVLLLIFSFIIGAWESVLQLLLLAFIANILSALRGLRLPFSVNWKMMTAASFIPTLFFVLLNSFLIIPYGQTTILAAVTAYLYHQAVKEFLNKKG